MRRHHHRLHPYQGLRYPHTTSLQNTSTSPRTTSPNSQITTRPPTTNTGGRHLPLKILILGAGAIGSLFGAYLSTKHQVTLLCRTPHAQAINQNGLQLSGQTNNTYTPQAIDTLKNITTTYDLAIITVKAYDTQQLLQSLKPIQNNLKIILTLQNGLGNIHQIQQTLPQHPLIAGITTHGAIHLKPGIIQHTGKGRTIIGTTQPKTQPQTKQIIQNLNDAGIPTSLSKNIQKEIFIKAIINSSINPLTTIFQCKNGYLLKNPILKNILTQLIIESTTIIKTQQPDLTTTDMINQTKQVIQETQENYSSMLQSYQQNQKTEIDYINGTLNQIAHQHNIPNPLSNIITQTIHKLTLQ
jgi:2-dehydropantoate 2-reductase